MADGDYVNRNVCKNGTVTVPSAKTAAAAVLAVVRARAAAARGAAAAADGARALPRRAARQRVGR